MKYLSNIDLALNQLLNAAIHKLSSAPSSPVSGQLYYNTTTQAGFAWNGAQWRPLDAAQLSDGSISISALAVNPLARSTHTGSQTASTISDLASVVKAYTLDSFASAVAALNLGGQKISNLSAGTVSTDAVNLGQMTTAIASAIAGQAAVKNPVRVLASTPISTSGLQTIDGVTLAAGDRVLCTAQAVGTNNLIFVASAGAWTVSTDISAGTLIEGTDVLVNEGTVYGGSIFRVTTQGTIVVGATAISWTQTARISSYTGDGVTVGLVGTVFSVLFGYGLSSSTGSLTVDKSKIVSKYSGTITGDGATTVFTLTHGLGNSCPSVVFRDSTGNEVLIDSDATSSNALVVTFGIAPSSGTTYSALVQG